MDLERIARLARNTDARIAYGLASCGSDVQSYGGVVALTAASVNVPTPITFQQIPTGCYVEDFTFDVETPNLAPGSILRGQQQHYNALHPGVDMKIQINQGLGPLNQVLNSAFQPLQHLVRNTAAPSPTCCDWLKGKYFWAWQSVTAEVLLKRTLTAGEDPYKISFGLKVNVIDRNIAQITWDEAVSGLGKLGIEIPQAVVQLQQRRSVMM
jgi:hypothetical protein